MNKDTLQGEWKQLKGSVKQKWADLTDDDLAHVEGSRDKLVGKIQERYGQLKDEVEAQVDEWLAKLHHHAEKAQDDNATDTTASTTTDSVNPDTKG
ncbi:CsbD family protein [Psychrobacter sp. I-STPA6b]|uniref:CsbD family protein n=1 Tax=Psychrobacter sp. I-STPA6b TaxID=2585718 RepID=UPI001D0C9A78